MNNMEMDVSMQKKRQEEKLKKLRRVRDYGIPAKTKIR
jgi:hypothetical protein